MFRCDYNVYSTFQSHEPEFDYLKSLEIEEKINQISWVKPSGSSLFLLTTNGQSFGGSEREREGEGGREEVRARGREGGRGREGVRGRGRDGGSE